MTDKKEGSMNTNLLITYGSWADSTKGIAIAIAENLQQIPNIQADVQPAKIVKDITPYQAVIIGTGVRAGTFHPSVVSFVKRHQKALLQIPSAFFINCLTMREDNQANRDTTTAFMKKLSDKVPGYQPAALGLFAGVMDFEKLPFIFRIMFKNSKEISEGDFRDWDKIKQWSLETADLLLPQTV
jgi:menaquinone-dependent protoporphyrinogen oxidase